MRVSIRGVPWLAGVAVACAACFSKTEPPPVFPNANVVLVSLDTLRADHLGVYGYPRDTSPHIDALAREAVVFRQAVAPASTTLPSHATLFTGLSPASHGVLMGWAYHASERLDTLAEILRGAGYATASINGGGYLERVFGLAQGFDFVDSQTHQAGHRSTTFADRVARLFAWLDEGVRLPFFVFLHSYEVHIPLTPARRHLEAFGEGSGGDFADGIRNWEARLRRRKVVDPVERGHWIDLYDASIRSADEGMAALVAGLRARGLWDESIVIVVSDHGEELGERGAFSLHTGNLHDEILLVPLIIKFPRSQYRGRSVEDQVALADVVPTLLAALGVSGTRRFDGANLLPLLHGEEPARPRPLVSMSKHGRTLRAPPWKLHRDGRGVRLFDLRTDAGEERNVADDHPATVASLLTQLERRAARRHRSDDESAQETKAPSPDVIRQLRELGYVD